MVVSSITRLVSVGQFGPSVVVISEHNIVFKSFHVASYYTVATYSRLNPGHRARLHCSLDVLGVCKSVDCMVV